MTLTSVQKSASWSARNGPPLAGQIQTLVFTQMRPHFRVPAARPVGYFHGGVAQPGDLTDSSSPREAPQHGGPADFLNPLFYYSLMQKEYPARRMHLTGVKREAAESRIAHGGVRGQTVWSSLTRRRGWYGD